MKLKKKQEKDLKNIMKMVEALKEEIKKSDERYLEKDKQKMD